MDCEQVNLIHPDANEMALELSAGSQISALSDRYAARGLHKSVLQAAAKQIEREEETRALAPDAYRLSQMSEGAVRVHCRHGKDQMTSSDLVQYIRQTRAKRIRSIDFSAEPEATEDESEPSSVIAVEDETKPERAAKQIMTQMIALPRRATKQIAERLPAWFNNTKPDTSRETHRFPLSAFAAILAVALSLMLIVASSVLLTRAENGISALKEELDLLSGEVEEMQAEFEVTHDLLEIYRIATEEYGMVNEEYLKMHYLSLDEEDAVEVFEDEREETVSLSAILSAIGIK